MKIITVDENTNKKISQIFITKDVAYALMLKYNYS